MACLDLTLRTMRGRQPSVHPLSRNYMQTPKTDPQPRIRLTEARNNRGWSQLEVAERIGTTHVNVSRWERGITRPSPYFRRKLCQLFGKNEEELDLQAVPNVGAPLAGALPTAPSSDRASLAGALPTVPPSDRASSGASRLRRRPPTGRPSGTSCLRRRPPTGRPSGTSCLRRRPPTGHPSRVLCLRCRPPTGRPWRVPCLRRRPPTGHPSGAPCLRCRPPTGHPRGVPLHPVRCLPSCPLPFTIPPFPCARLLRSSGAMTNWHGCASDCAPVAAWR